MAEAIPHQLDAAKRRHALLRHDWKIASAGFAAIFRKPLDLLTVLVALPVFLFILRAWTANQPQPLLDLQAFAVGFAVAFYCLKALPGRCLYHRTDGILAAYAQKPSEQLAFALPLFGAAAALGYAYLLIVGAHRPLLWLAATMLGAIAGFAWANIARVLRAPQPVLLRWMKPRDRQHTRIQPMLIGMALISGATVAILPFGLPALAIVTVAISLLVSIALGRIDAAAVRYRTMIGHSSWTIVCSHIVPLLTFFGPFAAALMLAPHWALPALAFVLGLAVTVFIALRILAYQSFRLRIGDWVVTLLIGVVAMAGLALPPAAPVAMLFGIVWLARRAAVQKWLIA